MKEYITIDGFENLSQQELFDMAARHILSTRKQSEANGKCVYQGSGCAASPFIKEEYRSDADETGSWYALVCDRLVPDNENELIRKLQSAHDGWRGKGGLSSGKDFVTCYKESMHIIAKNFMLDPSVLNEDKQ